MTILLILAIGAVNVACFLIGAKVGQAVSKGEKVEIPSLNPVKVIQEHEAKREAQKEQERLDVILRNIEAYDGTSRGQEDIPRR